MGTKGHKWSVEIQTALFFSSVYMLLSANVCRIYMYCNSKNMFPFQAPEPAIILILPIQSIRCYDSQLWLLCVSTAWWIYLLTIDNWMSKIHLDISVWRVQLVMEAD